LLKSEWKRLLPHDNNIIVMILCQVGDIFDLAKMIGEGKKNPRELPRGKLALDARLEYSIN